MQMKCLLCVMSSMKHLSHTAKSTPGTEARHDFHVLFFIYSVIERVGIQVDRKKFKHHQAVKEKPVFCLFIMSVNRNCDRIFCAAVFLLENDWHTVE